MNKNESISKMLELLSRLEDVGHYFRWKPEFLPVKGRKSQKAGCVDWSGYDVITFKGSRFKVHRLIWLLRKGLPIPEFLDHIDGDRLNNNIDNLRPSTTRENGKNRIEHRNGKLLGTYFRKDTGKWCAQIWVNKKKLYLGAFSTMEEAHSCYQNFVKSLDNDQKGIQI